MFYFFTSYLYSNTTRYTVCCILRGRGEGRIVDIVTGGTKLEIQLRRGDGQAAHTRNNPHVKCNGVY
jgi:hypothetical protein